MAQMFYFKRIGSIQHYKKDFTTGATFNKGDRMEASQKTAT